MDLSWRILGTMARGFVVVLQGLWLQLQLPAVLWYASERGAFGALSGTAYHVDIYELLCRPMALHIA